MKTLNFLLILLVMALVSCANQGPKPPKTQEIFKTVIKQDGTKQFSYLLIIDLPKDKLKREPESGPPGGFGSPRPHKGHNPHDMNDDRFGDLFDDLFQQKLNTTGFCHRGFKQIDKQIRLGAYQIRAECHDLATDADREKFPNPAPQKVKEETIE